MLPYKRFVVAQLFLGKTPSKIGEKLRVFGYDSREEEIKDIFLDMKEVMPESIRSILNEGRPVLVSESSTPWFKFYGITEYMEYATARITDAEKTPHHTAFSHVLWILKNKVVATIVNALMFNEESAKSVATIINFKYKKKVSQKSIELYEKYYWDTSDTDAFEAIGIYTPFKDDSLVIRRIESSSNDNKKYLAGDPTTNHASYDFSEAHNGDCIAILFRDNKYIKWKLDYKDIEVPSAKTFLESVKTDSMFLYEEAKGMSQVISKNHTMGQQMHPETGEMMDVSSTSIAYKNVQNERFKAMKSAVDMFVKADDAIPEETAADLNSQFFTKMAQLSIQYGNYEDAGKIVTGDDAKDILDDIVQDKVI